MIGVASGGVIQSIIQGIQEQGSHSADDQLFSALQQLEDARNHAQKVGTTLKALGVAAQFFPGYGTAAGVGLGILGSAYDAKAGQYDQQMNALANQLGAQTGAQTLGQLGLGPGMIGKGSNQQGGNQQGFGYTGSRGGQGPLPTLYATRDANGNLIFTDREGNVIVGPDTVSSVGQ